MNLDTVVRVHGSADQHSIEIHVPLPHDPNVVSRIQSLLNDVEHTARQNLADSTAVARWKRFRPQLKQARDRAAAAAVAVKAASARLVLVEVSPGTTDDHLGDIERATAALAAAEQERASADEALALLAAKAPQLWDAAASTVRSSIAESRLGLERTLTERTADARAALVEKLDALKHVFAGLVTYHCAASAIFGQRDHLLEMTMRDEFCGEKPEAAPAPASTAAIDGVIQFATRRVG